MIIVAFLLVLVLVFRETGRIGADLLSITKDTCTSASSSATATTTATSTVGASAGGARSKSLGEDADSNNNISDDDDNDNNDNNDNDDVRDDNDQLTTDLISWLRTNGAFIDSRLAIRHVDPTDPSSPRGIFADYGPFEQGEILFTIPNELIYDGRVNTLKGNADMKWRDTKDDCGTTYEIYHAMVFGTTPYGRYLASQPRRYVPGYWSPNGRKLLNQVLGDRLPPQDAVEDAVQTDWLEYCDGATSDEMEIHASQLVTARADGRLMVPYYDMINHRNGKWYNAQHYRPPDGGFSLVANQRVERGEQLYCSYNTCTICGSRMDGWGTPDIFEFYGFVEPLPQRYILEEFRLKFGLDEKGGSKDNAVMRRGSKFGTASHGDDEDDDEDDDVELEVKWYVPPSQKGLDFLRTELERLKQVGTKKDQSRNTVDQEKDEDGRIPESEWNAIWSYHQALVVAFTTALQQAPEAVVSEEVWDMGAEDWYKERPDVKPPNRFY